MRARTRDGPEGAGDTALFDDADAVTSAVLDASRLLIAVSLRSLAAAEQRVTLPQFRLLLLLDGHGETNLVTLAERLSVHSSTALRMVDRLAHRDLVSRRVNPDSRREVLLRLTATGHRIVEEVTARRREEIAAIVARMPARSRAGLVTAMRSFAAADRESAAADRESAAADRESGGAARDPVPLGWK
jgi:DNA-binding MarR family transcriptional regulator